MWTDCMPVCQRLRYEKIITRPGLTYTCLNSKLFCRHQFKSCFFGSNCVWNRYRRCTWVLVCLSLLKQAKFFFASLKWYQRFQSWGSTLVHSLGELVPAGSVMYPQEVLQWTAGPFIHISHPAFLLLAVVNVTLEFFISHILIGCECYS